MNKGEPDHLMQHVQLLDIHGTNTLCCQAEHLLPLTLQQLNSALIRVLQGTPRKVVMGAVGAPIATAGAFRRAMETTVIALKRVTADKVWVTA